MVKLGKFSQIKISSNFPKTINIQENGMAIHRKETK